MTGTFAGFISVVALTVGLSAWVTPPPSAQKDEHALAQSVAGRWTMTTDASGPHGSMTMDLVLTQKGKKVSGTFSSPHTGDLPVEGEFADGTLKLATTSGEPEMQITFNAKLKNNGTLAGYLSASVGDMTWTAERVKDKR